LEKKEIGFASRVIKEGKITIPIEIRNHYDLREGDTVYITGIRKLEPGEVE